MNGSIIILLFGLVLIICLATFHIWQSSKCWPGYDVDDEVRKVNEKA